MFRWALCPFNQVQLKIKTAAYFKVQRSLALFELDDSFAVSRLHLKAILQWTECKRNIAGTSLSFALAHVLKFCLLTLS